MTTGRGNWGIEVIKTDAARHGILVVVEQTRAQ